jgi:hypothetical protein
MNPWLWFGASYAVLYVIGLIIGATRGAPDLAYRAGYYFPITILAVVLGVWRAPKWKDVHESEQSDQESITL